LGGYWVIIGLLGTPQDNLSVINSVFQDIKMNDFSVSLIRLIHLIRRYFCIDFYSYYSALKKSTIKPVSPFLRNISADFSNIS
jgi:hypothetical protein